MFTDMVGFSALAQRNEARAIELLEEQRQVVRSVLPRHGGREVKTTGDGFLIEFPSALAAVQGAVEIQQAMYERNRNAAAENKINIRIGIHVGDVIARQGDIHGDGVNIAARLEPLAAPGGICISSAVWEQVRNKVSQPLALLGPAELKNIELPVVVHRVVMPWESATNVPRLRARRSSAWQIWVGAAVLVVVVLAAALWWQLGQIKANNGILFQTGFEAPSVHPGLLDGQDGWFARGGRSPNAARVVSSRTGQLISISGPDVELVTSNLYSAWMAQPLTNKFAGSTPAQISVSADFRFEPGATGSQAAFNSSVLMLNDEGFTAFAGIGVTKGGRVFGQNYARPNQIVYAEPNADPVHHLRADMDFNGRKARFFVDGVLFGTVPFNPQSSGRLAYVSMALQADRPTDSLLQVDNLMVRTLQPAPAAAP